LVYLTTLFNGLSTEALNDRLMCKRLIGEDVEGSGRGLICHTNIRLERLRKGMEYISVPGSWAEI